jgi:hypothetical protein
VGSDDHETRDPGGSTYARRDRGGRDPRLYRARSPKFYPDDRFEDVEDQDASGARAEMSTPGRLASHSRCWRSLAHPAMNVNSINEAPDSSWFTNRIGASPRRNCQKVPTLPEPFPGRGRSSRKSMA